MKNTWWEQKAIDLQEAADTCNTKSLFEGLKAIYGPRANGSTPVLGADDTTLLTDKDERLARWAEHFNLLLNKRSDTLNEAIDDIPQLPIIVLVYRTKPCRGNKSNKIAVNRQSARTRWNPSRGLQMGSCPHCHRAYETIQCILGVTVFADLTKAFDTVSREGLYKLLHRVGCPDRLIAIIQSFHDGMMGWFSTISQSRSA